MHFPSTRSSRLFAISASQKKEHRECHMRRPAHNGDVVNSITVINLCCGTYRHSTILSALISINLALSRSSFAVLQPARSTAIQLVVSVFMIMSRTETASLLSSKRASSTVGSISIQLILPLKVKFILL